ncbi:MAG: GNAT family N-acetyltransferase [Anaerolineales bacterium]
MQYTLHKDFSELDSGAWNDLLAESVTNAPFLRYEYQEVWWRHRGGGEWQSAQLALISANEGGRLVGIAPLFIAEHEGQPALLLVGSIEISDYLDVITRPADHADFISGLLDFIAREHLPRLDWYNLPDESATLSTLQVEAARRGWPAHQEIYRPTPRIPLQGSFDDYLQTIEKKQRHEIRRKLRRAEESGRGVRWEISSMQDVEAEIDSFLALMEQAPEKAEFLRPAMRAQLRDVIRTARAHGWLWLAFLEADGQRIAAALNFDYDNKLWGYNAGVNHAFMDLSPGWVLLTYTLQWCCENRRREFDFMRGDEEYKYRFGGSQQAVMRINVSF